VYRRGSGRTVLLVGVYVDDLIITGVDPREEEGFKAAMKEQFDMRDLDLLCFYLGVEVRQDANGITLRQAHYAERILELGEMAGCNSATTPMEEKLRLSRESKVEEVDPTHYRRLVGNLRYLVARPSVHCRVPESLQGADYGLHYIRAPGTARFVGYCDSDLAGDIDTSRSNSGTMFYLGDCLVSWQSIKQKVVALSSCKAEYIATTTAATQALWLSRLLGKLLDRKVEVVELKVDSKSALVLAKNHVFHNRSKHIRTKYHFIRECLEEGSIKANYIATTDQLADILTKFLGKAKFQEMRRIGLKQITQY
jgi:hypothetical protein